MLACIRLEVLHIKLHNLGQVGVHVEACRTDARSQPHAHLHLRDAAVDWLPQQCDHARRRGGVASRDRRGVVHEARHVGVTYQLPVTRHSVLARVLGRCQLIMVLTVLRLASQLVRKDIRVFGEVCATCERARAHLSVWAH